MSGWIQAAMQQNTMATVPIFILTITENGLATSNHRQMPYQQVHGSLARQKNVNKVNVNLKIQFEIIRYLSCKGVKQP